MVDNLIKIFDEESVSFETNGIGCLIDATKAEVTEELNGAYELELQYPISGQHFQSIKHGRIITVKPNPFSDKYQPFRIYNISRPINGLITVRAEHISYDFTGFPVNPFSARTVEEAMSGIQANSLLGEEQKFSYEILDAKSFPTDTYDDEKKEYTSDYYFIDMITPASIRTILGGDGGVLYTFGGELEFDEYKVILRKERGVDKGVTVRYGKNLTDLTQEENIADMYTGVYPYWYSDEYGLITLPDPIVPIIENPKRQRVLPLDLSSYWENLYGWRHEYPSVDEIKDTTDAYIKVNRLGEPAVSLTISFLSLAKSKEYDAVKELESVQLGDYVTVEFPELQISTPIKAHSKCVKTVYDAIKDDYVSITLGEMAATLTDNIASLNNAEHRVVQALNNTKTGATINNDIERATELITGNSGGYVVINKDSEGKPFEILIMDTPTISTARSVWRWNKNGLGYSSNGVSGPYGLAITSEGKIVADYIRSGKIVVGGEGNVGGIEILGEDGSVLIKMDKTGLDMLKNCRGNFQGNLIAERIVANSSYYISDGDRYDKNLRVLNLLTNAETDTSSLNVGKLDKSGNVGNEPNYIGFNDITQERANTEGLPATRRQQILHADEVISGGRFIPSASNKFTLGSSNYKWSSVFAKNAEINTSDATRKREIRSIDKKYENLWFSLNPVSYMFNDGDRTHIGITAQDLKENMDVIGITPEELGAFCHDVTDDGDEYGIRYQEFIMLNTHMLQKAYKIIFEQQNAIETLKRQINKDL